MGAKLYVAWLDGAVNVESTFVYGLHVNVPEYMTMRAGTFRILLVMDALQLLH